MVGAEECNFNDSPVGCMASAIGNQLARSIAGSPGAKNQLSVGIHGGDIPILPAGCTMILLLTGTALRVVFGRPRFMPRMLSSMVARLAIFVALFAITISVVKSGEAAMKEKDARQGPNFLPVTTLTTSGPYEYTRNPMYSCMTLIIPAFAILTDSLWMGAAMGLMPIYLDQYVIPAEEALLRKLFGKAFDKYAKKVPRWLMRREAPDDDRRGRDAEREPPPRARERVDEVDEFGRVRPPPKSPPRRESSASRERRRRERKERKREERKARHGAAAAENHGGADYRESILPPGADLSLYTYDPATYWHVTGDNVWWYRPDLSLWYDCRSETYYTYDASLSEYIGVDRETATSALAEGRNVAPEAPAAAGASEAAEAAEGGEGNATADGGGADGAGPSEQAGESSDAAVFGPIGPAAPSGVGGEDGEEEGEEEGARGPTGEEAVALQLRAHTESWQGKKETQEDRFIQSTRLAKLGTVFGVFDGHGGVHAAEYVAKHLPNNVALCLQKRSVTASASRRDSHGGGPSADSKRLLSALEEAFPLTDRELMSLSRRKAHTDGTTALLVIVHGDDLDSLQLYCAHVGDCRAVLCRGGNALRLTQDHRPDRKDEQQRIRAAGGGVFQVSGIWRCTSAAGAARAKDSRAGFSDGESHTYLSCSRTLGDPELKMNAERPILSNVPDTSATRLLEDDLFFVTACDGVWDVLSDQKVCDIVLEHWGDPAAAASTIVRTALSTGSGDNLTAQVVLFGWKHEAGVAAAARRMREREEEKKKASAPKEKIVVEEDLDMFS